jgi:hypothetical protein
VLNQQPTVQRNGIAHGNERKVAAVRLPSHRIDGRRATCSVAGAQHVGTYNEVFLRIEGLAWPEHACPPALGVRCGTESATGYYGPSVEAR